MQPTMTVRPILDILLQKTSYGTIHIWPQTDLGRLHVQDNFYGAAATFGGVVSVRDDFDTLTCRLKMAGMRVGER